MNDQPNQNTTQHALSSIFGISDLMDQKINAGLTPEEREQERQAHLSNQPIPPELKAKIQALRQEALTDLASRRKAAESELEDEAQ